MTFVGGEQLGEPLPRAMQPAAQRVLVDAKDRGELFEVVPFRMQRQQRSLLGVETMPNGREALVHAPSFGGSLGARFVARAARRPSSSSASATSRERRRAASRIDEQVIERRATSQARGFVTAPSSPSLEQARRQTS